MGIDYSMIGMRLQKQRISAALTQDVVAEIAGITTVYLSKIENGKAAPTLDTLSHICSVIGADLGYIISGRSSVETEMPAEPVLELYHACAPEVKPIALKLLRELSRLHSNTE